MKIIPKFQKGGGFESFFTTYIPLPNLAATTSKPSLVETKTKKEKGELTEKDFFDMLKDVNGLPNEMQDIIGSLVSTFLMLNLTGLNTSDLATMYLSSLYRVKVATDNKKIYDEAVTNAYKNGSMAEPAISMDGKLIVLDNNGAIHNIDLETYFRNKDEYTPLTVSNLANMRKWDPQLSYNLSVFDIINNSMGFEAFLALLDKAKTTLGNSLYSETGISDKNVLRGLQYIQQLPDDLKEEVINLAINGVYSYTTSTSSNLVNINSLINYLMNSIPDRAKTWAAWKLQTSDKEAATKQLIGWYLGGLLKDSTTFTINAPKQSTDSSSNSSSSSSDEDPKEGYWRLIQVQRGGSEQNFTILNNNVLLTVTGKYYGTSPGLEKSKSLEEYLNTSGIGYIIKNRNNITFGDIAVSPDSYKDIVVDANSGMMVVTLPITSEGKVDFSVLDTYQNIISKLKEEGLEENTLEYNLRLVSELLDANLGYLVDTMSGKVDSSKLGNFYVLRGISSDKAQYKDGRNKVSIRDANSEFIIDESDDIALYDIIEQVLSNKDIGEYDLDREDWFEPHKSNWYDHVYTANIFIPINQSPISGMNADENKIKESTSRRYEYEEQQRLKLNNQGATRSNIL